MISIIICSKKKVISVELKENINSSIGLEYELIIIANLQNTYSIFQAYNEGVRRAKYPYLCFMHEDVLYHTHNWGEKIVSHFKNEKVGLIGVLGSHYMSKCGIYWGFTEMLSGTYLQDKLIGNKITQDLIKHEIYLKNNNSIEAVVVDGLWFCIPKEMFKYIQFDSNNFSGFHGYDMDISLQVRDFNKEVRIISDILIEHNNIYGINNFGLWIESMEILSFKWGKKLPQFAGVFMSKEEVDIKESHLHDYFDLFKSYNNLVLEVNAMRNSKAYRFGKFLLRPLSMVKSKF